MGHMAAMTYVVEHARLHFRCLQHWITTVYTPNVRDVHKRVPFPAHIRNSLAWWTVPKNLISGVPFHRQQPTTQLTTDALLLGWGAHLEHNQVQGLWSPMESMMHINLLELRAVCNACRHFLPKICTQTVRILSDNMTTVYYINRQGGAQSQSLCAEAIALWDWCIHHKISLIAEYLPGQQNSMADALSRHFSLKHEWEFQLEVLSTIFCSWGFPTVDLFATRMNAKCPRCCSRAGMGRNSKGDAFLYDWSHQLLYAWPRQTWFPYLHQMSVRPPFPLPKRRDLLVQNNQRLFHPQIDLLALTAWFLVGSNKQK
nr:uncharacterized protein LOC112544649 [Pelodiscus sinensis]|eukprot:XP_025037028.1 uncharacterized protein LOC112544649 [Pelodiscus sinensis]